MYMVVKDSEITLMKFSVLLFFEFLQMIQYAFSGNVSNNLFKGSYLVEICMEKW